MLLNQLPLYRMVTGLSLGVTKVETYLSDPHLRTGDKLSRLKASVNIIAPGGTLPINGAAFTIFIFL